jgi:hypothetical protein
MGGSLGEDLNDVTNVNITGELPEKCTMPAHGIATPPEENMTLSDLLGFEAGHYRRLPSGTSREH